MNIFRGIPSYQEEPDASVMKLGAHLDTLQMIGIWNGSQQNHHINWLEMKAVQLALIHFLPKVRSKRVLIRRHNLTGLSLTSTRVGRGHNVCLHGGFFSGQGVFAGRGMSWCTICLEVGQSFVPQNGVWIWILWDTYFRHSIPQIYTSLRHGRTRNFSYIAPRFQWREHLQQMHWV